MANFLIVAIAIFIDRLLGEPTIYHPLRGFRHIATFIEQLWHGAEELITVKEGQPNQTVSIIVKIKGLLAVLFLVLPFVALTSVLCNLGLLNFVFNILFLYLCIGAHSLKQHALDVQNALTENNIDEARKKAALVTDRDTENMNSQDILLACVESILKKGNNDVLAPIFWYMLLGAPGAVLYRLVDSLANMWNDQKSHYSNFGWAATRFDYVLNFIPARLTALSYKLLGEIKTGPDILQACSLVERSMVLWLAIILSLSFTHC